MSLEQLKNLTHAGYPLIAIETHETDRVVAEISKSYADEGAYVADWDLIQGWNGPVLGETAEDPDPSITAVAQAVNVVDAVVAGQAEPWDGGVVLLRNFHVWLGDGQRRINPMLLQTICNAVPKLKGVRLALVMLGPGFDIPVELERSVAVVEWTLPDREAMGRIIDDLAESNEFARPGDETREHLLDMGRGLTQFEFENALALSLASEGDWSARIVWDWKSQAVKKNGNLTIHSGGESFDAVGGLENLKTFCARLLRDDAPGDVVARGVLLLGVPGTGKSLFAKALGNEVRRPTLALDFGRLFGSLVGQSEAAIRNALAVVDAMSPCILFIDEIEKGLAGAGGGGENDSGVTKRLFGTFLTWLNDHTTDVFVVATCNDIKALPPEFARAERWDALFFVDLPNPAERSAIWDIYLKAYRLNGRKRPALPDDSTWTGAEIRSCCRLAHRMGVSLAEAAECVVPVMATASERIGGLRKWAEGRCLAASYPGRYSTKGPKAAVTGRKVARAK